MGEARFLLSGPWIVEFEPSLALVCDACSISSVFDFEPLSRVAQFSVLLVV